MNSPDLIAIVAALLALVLLVDISVLWLTGRQVPELLSQLIFGIFGFYFGRSPGIGGANGPNGSNGADRTAPHRQAQQEPAPQRVSLDAPPARDGSTG